MSLTKIPLVILFALAFKRTVTPPNSPASESETFVKSGLIRSWYLVQIRIWRVPLQMLASSVEVATILAYHYPNFPYAKAIISALAFNGGNPANLRLTPVNFLGGIMTITGSFIRVATYHYLGKFFRFEASVQKDHQLITGGPYSVVRHPSYTGLLFTHLGWLLWNFGAGAWIRASGLLNTAIGRLVVFMYAIFAILGTLQFALGRMGSEDRALRKTFGTQ